MQIKNCRHLFPCVLLLTFGAVLVACGGGEGAPEGRAQALGLTAPGVGSVITWNPNSLSFSINPGGKQDVAVSFTPRIALTNVSVAVAPDLLNVIAVTPSFFASVAPGQRTTVVVTVSPVSSAMPQRKKGTISLSTGSLTVATPLTVLITIVAPETINGVVVPPEPPPNLNGASLAGFDTNLNGVRDDVDRRIAQTFGGTTDFSYAAAVAREYQKQIADPPPITRDEALAQVARLLCAARGASREVYKSGLGEQTANTDSRKLAKRTFNDVLVGYTHRELPPCTN